MKRPPFLFDIYIYMGKYTNETWIEEAEKKYPGRFGYDETRYIDSYNKVKIKCLKHNEIFEVPPISFIRSSACGNFCPECKHNEKITQLEFLERAKERFPLLDFSKSEYKNYRSNIIIVCPNHGEFTKQARRVLHGQDEICPQCINENITERHFNLVEYYTKNVDKGSDPGIFYKLKVTHKPSNVEFLKIGFTSLTSYQRYKSSKYKDFEFEVIDEVHTTNIEAVKLELEYKRANKDKHFFLPKDVWFAGRNELYEMDGYYQLKSSQVKFIRDCLLEKQGGKCPLCGCDVKMPTLDHYHSRKHYGSGLVRGVLCNTCNRITGVIENNFVRNGIDYSDAPQFLRELADYLKNKRERYIHPTEKPKALKLMKSSYKRLVKVIAGKQKVPEYNGKLTKKLEELYKKYMVIPEFHR